MGPQRIERQRFVLSLVVWRIGRTEQLGAPWPVPGLVIEAAAQRLHIACNDGAAPAGANQASASLRYYPSEDFLRQRFERSRVEYDDQSLVVPEQLLHRSDGQWFGVGKLGELRKLGCQAPLN